MNANGRAGPTCTSTITCDSSDSEPASMASCRDRAQSMVIDQPGTNAEIRQILRATRCQLTIVLGHVQIERICLVVIADEQIRIAHREPPKSQQSAAEVDEIVRAAIWTHIASEDGIVGRAGELLNEQGVFDPHRGKSAVH